MALTQEDIEFIKTQLGEWLAEQALGRPSAVGESELRERKVRVKEDLRHQRELLREGFGQLDRRFQEVDKSLALIDQGLARVDQGLKRIDQGLERMDRRFDELTRRLGRFMFWSFGLILSLGALAVAAIRLWP